MKQPSVDPQVPEQQLAGSFGPSDYTPERWSRIERVLDAVLEVEAGEWPALLDRLCGGDSALRREVDTLLRRHTQAQGFLNAPAAGTGLMETESAAGVGVSQTQRPVGGAPPAGRRIGVYRVLREIARGGMGRVLLAERADGQFEQRVAIKLLLSGLDTEEAVRRFRAERQILATLAYPSIARLLDGGITDEGTPFLVMELVEGEPIDRYCEGKGLSIRDRLRLFLQVAEAVQYAHRSLIVHRDLKPSNIHITPDGQVKLLDFGIAKLLAEEAMPESAPRTMMGGRWMTPEYAAPEQIRGEPVTTTTDVYQLGVVLYELLTGRRPFERNGGSLHDLEQAVLTREPEKPSTAVTLGNGRSRSPDGPARRADEAGRTAAAQTEPTQVGERHRSRPESLHRILRGDLDAIVLKSLRKEPLTRYASAQALAGDIASYLSGLPVTARRGTAAYRARKFVRRHRWGVGMVAALTLLLAGYAVMATVQGARVRQALAQSQVEAAKAQQVGQFLMGLFEASDAAEATGEEVTARQLLERGVTRADELSGQPEVQAEMLNLVGEVYQHWGAYDRAQPLLERGLALRRQVLGTEHEDVAQSLNDLGTLLRMRGQYAAAESLLERAVAMRRKVLGDAHRDVARSQLELAALLEQRGHDDRAEVLYREALAIQRRQLDPKNTRLARTMNDLGFLLWRRGDLEAAEPLLREALGIYQMRRGEEHWYVATVTNNLGMVLLHKGDYAAAESLFVRSLAMKRTLLGEEHLGVAASLIGLGEVSRKRGDYEKADSLFRRALQIRRGILGYAHPAVATSLTGLAQAHLDRGRASEAEPLLREALEIRRKAAPDDRRRMAEVQSVLGRCLTMLGQYDEAEGLLAQSYAVLQVEYGEAHPRTQDARQYLADLFTTEGKMTEAAKYLPPVRRE